MKPRNLLTLTLFLTLLLCLTGGAWAESAHTLTLPASLDSVAAESFYKATSLEKVVVPEGATEIGSLAFAYSSITEISLPRSLRSIAENAFDGCGQFKVDVPIGSYAWKWCVEHGYLEKPETTPAEYFTNETINGLYARITGYTGTDSVVVIPEEIDDYIISEIGAEAFISNKTMIYVEIPDSVTELGKRAFSYCYALEAIDLGNGVTTVGNWAFSDNPCLVEIDFPSSVTTMGRGALQSCANLERVGYPVNWESANSYGEVFADCPKLTEITVPTGVTVIPNYAFANCPNLQRINLPEGLEYVYHHAFSNCTGLTEMIYPSTIKTVGGIDGCTGIHEIVIPNEAETIGTNAFDSVPITSISIPASVTEIYNYAFYNCSNLNTIIFYDGLKSIGSYVFYNCVSINKLLLPDSIESVGSYAFANCSNLSEFKFPVNWTEVTSISSTTGYGHHFDNCTKLRTIDIPMGASVIPQSAFSNATYLRNVTIPNSVHTIYTEAFRGCTAITSINLPEGLTVISSIAFRDCTNLKTIVFSSSLKDIYHFAFMNCSSLKQVLLPDGMTTIGTRVFADCVSLESINYPLSLNTTIRYPYDYRYEYGCNFMGCKKLKSIDIPEGVTSIPNGIFNQSDYLVDISFPSTLVNIDCFAFSGCSSLKAAMLPDSLSSIGVKAFEDCINLETIHYPKSLNTTTYYPYDYRYPYGCVFIGCSELKEVEIPIEVSTIPRGLFRYADGLEKIYLGDNIKQIGELAFDNCPSLTIWTEYDAYALQYAKDNSIPYYYLTPDGVNSPSGTLYKGDSYALYGYARSSVNITEITGSILDSAGNTVQTVTVAPNVTDFNLAGDVNASLIFGTLPLGSYQYTLSAKTAVSEELWAKNSFTIVPAPLRISTSNLVIPSGVSSIAGSSLGISGMIYSNYIIDQVYVGLFYQGTEVRSFTATPKSYSYDLSAVNAGIDASTLPDVDYSIRITVTSNGQTRVLSESGFLKGNFQGDLSDKTYAAVVKFANSKDSSNFFSMGIADDVLSEMDFGTVFLMGVNARTKWLTGKVASIFNQGNNTYLVSLYEKEICNVLQSMGEYPDLISSASDFSKDIQSYIMALVKSSSMFLGDELKALDKTGLFSDETLATMRGWDNALRTIKDADEVLKWTDTTARGALNILLSEENGLRVLDAIQESSGHSGNKEYAYAIRKLRAKYSSETKLKLLSVLDLVGDNITSSAIKEITDYFTNLGSGIGPSYWGHLKGGSLYSLANLAIDVGMTVSGLDDIADNYMDFMIQAENYSNAIVAYDNALSAVRDDKDTSTQAVAKLKICFDYAKACGIAIDDTISGINQLSAETLTAAMKDKTRLTAYSIDG